MTPPALLALLGAPVAFANGNGSLGQTYNQSLAGGGVVSQGVGLRASIGTPGTGITISGIPSGATVVQAYLYVVQIVSSTSSYDTSFTLAGNTVTGSLIGTSGDTCWSFAGNVTLRADVTSIVTGNGAYSLSGVGNGSSQLGQGASLVVVYRDTTSTNTTRVVINDGAISGSSSGQVMSTALTGFTVPSGVTAGKLHLAMGDSQSFGDGAVIFEGSSVLAANSFNGHDGAGWDDYSITLSTSLFTPGDTSFTVSNTIDGDCLVWPYAAVTYTSCTPQTWYRDADGDGYGGSTTTSSCTAPSGYIATGGDCDDSRNTVYPGATEFCNTRDDDCDGTVDEDSAADARTWYRDADSDSYGNVLITDVECYQPTGFVADATDCDDARALTNPGASETCNGIDDDCDRAIDEDSAVDAVTWYRDADGDSFGNAAVTDVECYQPTGYVGDATDCDDTRALTYPGADEYCNGIDDDCDTAIDEDSAVDASTWYRDADGDSYGDPLATDVECNQPTGFVADATDCDDTDGAEFPGAPEYCDGDDDDCDAEVDEDDAVDVRTWYRDLDDDSFGDPAVSDIDCTQPEGFLEDNSDCDDGDASVYPGAEETPYDGVDQDCNGEDQCDVDDDGFLSELCPDGDDCDDEDEDINPDADETWYDGVDGDCDDGSDYDADLDGFDSESYGGDDCDDARADVYPGAADEPYDGDIQDCEGADEYDADGDGFDSADYGGDDCDDANSSINPDGAEVWYDGVDQDCDDQDDDQDNDGYGVEDDCDDLDPDSYPGAAGLNDDCTPVVDEPEVDTGGLSGDPVDGNGGIYKGGCAQAPSSRAGLLGVFAGLLGLLGLRRRR